MRFEKKLNCGEHTSFVIQELTSHGVGIRAKNSLLDPDSADAA